VRHCIATLLLLFCGALAAPRAHTASDESSQRALIDAAVAGFSVDRPGGARVFFLGFAGFGEERVFAEEIKLAADRVGERFGSSGRSLLLINDRRDLETRPFATHDNLRYALSELRRLMDPERDVLFLALSSHGRENAMLEVSNTGMEPTGLSAPGLVRLLAESGIRRKVIVISACFSGAFIEPLADDETIVITAAAKDRPSFGCSDERHLTYFGEAFYRDALPRARSLRAAFEAARADIARREKELKVRPSRPQARFGSILEAELADQRSGESVPGTEIPGIREESP
jgi:hypothetical protein